MIFLDASIVAAYYLPEAYSSQAQAIYQGNAILAVSDLVELEMFSVLSRLVRIQSLDLEAAKRSADRFTTHLEEDFYTRLHLDTAHYHLARDLIARLDLPLKAPDALHLALCATEGLQLVTADRQLARNAEVLEVKVQLIREA